MVGCEPASEAHTRVQQAIRIMQNLATEALQGLMHALTERSRHKLDHCTMSMQDGT